MTSRRRIGRKIASPSKYLRRIWRSNFTLPRRHKTGGDGWFNFLLFWLWSVVGVVPGAVAAADVIGYFHITDQQVQDVLSVTLAVLSMLLTQIIAWAVAALLVILVNGGRTTLGDRWNPGWLIALVFLFVCPFVLAGGAFYWYFTHPSISSDVATRGAAGALALKVVLMLVNVIVRPGIQSVVVRRITSRFCHWLSRDDTNKPRGA